MKLLTLLFFCAPLQAELVERVQAHVGEEMISLRDLNQFQRQLKAGLVPSLLLLEEVYEKPLLLKNKTQLLNFMIDRSMLFQIAQKEKIGEISKSEWEKRRNQLPGSSRKNFAQKLKFVGLNEAKLKEQILRDLKIESLLRQFVISTITVSEQDIESYHFNKYGQGLFKSFMYEFLSLSFSESQKPLVLKKLESSTTEDLNQLARSLGSETKSWKLPEKDIHPLFETELKKLSVSQMSPIILMGGDYYILQLKWKQAQIQPKDQEKKQRIEKELTKKKLKEEIKKWIEEKRTGFSIVIHSL